MVDVDDPGVDDPDVPDTDIGGEAAPTVPTVSGTRCEEEVTANPVELVEAKVVGVPAGSAVRFRSPVIWLATPTAAATSAKVTRNRLSNLDRCTMFTTPVARGIVRAPER